MERERDVLRRLAAARPPHLDGNAPVDPAVRTRELTAAMTAGPEGRTKPAEAALSRPRTPQWLRPRWGVGLVSAAAATAIAVTLIPSGGGSGPDSGDDPVSAAPGARPTARDFLLAAAAKVEKEGDDKTGAYWYRSEHSGQFAQVRGKDGGVRYRLDKRTGSRTWTARDENKRWSEYTDTGTRPASEADEAAWRAAGAPKNWPELRLSWKGKGLLAQDAPGGSGDTVPMGEIDIAELRKLPTGTKELKAHLRALVEKEFDAPEKHLRELTVWKAIEIATAMPAGPELRAAAYRVLAEEPGVRALGTVKDRSGREGHGVAIRTWDGNEELQLVLDRKTGVALGTLTLATKSDGYHNKGQLKGYTTIVDNTWTDTPPPFDKDLDPPRSEIDHDPDKAPEPGPVDGGGDGDGDGDDDRKGGEEKTDRRG
ncbi:CU044_5270 family protein [Streptomyces sp. NPDC000594]|uniref:CU044_5270 family protein n=1 Tax=Streptomyces sp. NPDC000594 TaxID=3154261 RepID=UPI003328FB94